MKTIQVRLPENIIKDIEKEVKEGNYESKSDYIRSKLKFEKVIDQLIGTMPNNGDSVKQVREYRKKHPIKSFEDIKKINELIK